jgi:hypothetical protein
MVNFLIFSWSPLIKGAACSYKITENIKNAILMMSNKVVNQGTKIQNLKNTYTSFSNKSDAKSSDFENVICNTKWPFFSS